MERKIWHWAGVPAQSHSVGAWCGGPHTSHPMARAVRPARSDPRLKSGPASQPTRRDARPGWSPRTGPPRWHGHRRPAVGQGAGAPVGLAPAGEAEGPGHSCGDGRSPGGRRDGGPGRRRSARRHFSTARVLLGLRWHRG
jgi:hypothetical protein